MPITEIPGPATMFPGVMAKSMPHAAAKSIMPLADLEAKSSDAPLDAGGSAQPAFAEVDGDALEETEPAGTAEATGSQGLYLEEVVANTLDFLKATDFPPLMEPFQRHLMALVDAAEKEGTLDAAEKLDKEARMTSAVLDTMLSFS